MKALELLKHALKGYSVHEKNIEEAIAELEELEQLNNLKNINENIFNEWADNNAIWMDNDAEATKKIIESYINFVIKDKE